MSYLENKTILALLKQSTKTSPVIWECKRKDDIWLYIILKGNEVRINQRIDGHHTVNEMSSDIFRQQIGRLIVEH